MKYEFDFQMDEETLEDFYRSHNLSGISGVLWPLLGVLSIALAFLSVEGTPVIYRFVYVALGLMFLFYIPWDLKRKAKKQVKTNPYYAKPIHYLLDEQGITSSQEDQIATVPWENFCKVKCTKKSMFVYMRNRSACVFSKKVFGDDLEEACGWIRSKVEHKKDKESK